MKVSVYTLCHIDCIKALDTDLHTYQMTLEDKAMISFATKASYRVRYKQWSALF